MRIDAHQHFWKFDPARDAWITDNMQIIRRDFLPADLKPLLVQNNINGCVAVQADQSETETDFLVQLAAENDVIKGVVGWIDLRAANVKERVEHYSQFKIVKGFRHILQGEAQRDLMLQPDFKNGIAALQSFNFTYDILIYPDQLPYAKQLAALFPEQKFVVDHLAKPYIKFKKIEQWKNDLKAIAQHQNVYCKLSGMTTEADWQQWQNEDLKPYIDVAVEAFGANRILFGSDWPVCLLAAGYKETVGIAQHYFSSFSRDEQNKVFGQNAVDFYNL